ncbi:hypothetical protein CRM22_001924 [Opisthorchis felineus]|uniref:Uncharacterized protein n=1 Tax=Opisthorchis felineus TaxID=147828 RepID=A0A4S2MED3_OPIFE|nr:hypothetical protein CRM22_001924 [Opisthorchis felineus]
MCNYCLLGVEDFCTVRIYGTPEAVNRRQQQEYLRAAEEVARQSAAAYLHFNKQQLSSSQASMLHDYFAQLTGQPGHQSSLFHPNTPAGNSHPFAAATQQYLVSNAGGSSLVHSDGSNFYANLSSQRQFESATQSNNYVQGPGAIEQQQNRSSMVG